MYTSFRKWLLPATLAGMLAAATASAIAQAPIPSGPNEPRPGTRADRREDRQEVRALRQQIRLDEQRLQADLRQFGENSLQVKADRARLRRDRRALRRLLADRKLDRRLGYRHHRRHRWNG